MIAEEQNTAKQLQRLGAQRQLYARGKWIFVAQIILSVPIAILTGVLSIWHPNLQSAFALWAITVTVCDVAWLAPWQNKLRDQAAKIQEIFDCEVLQLEWNTVKAGEKPDPELIIEQSNKYKTWSHKMPSILNWYSIEADQLPLWVGRIACQRSNCWWDAEQRRRYAACVGVGTALVFLILLSISFFNGLNLQKFTLNVVTPFLPALLLGIRQYQEHINTADRLDKLKSYAESIWEKAIAGETEEKLTVMSRNLQNEIFENRRNKPFIFDTIYKYFQAKFELNMNHGVAELVRTWKDAQ